MKQLIFFLLIFLSGYCFSQNPKYSCNNYTPDEYGKGYEATNWSCVQDKNGVMYFANAGGILQFDGINWNYISVGQNVWVRSLALGNDGIIYAGTENGFGYLKPNAVGILKYISLSDKLDDENKIFLKIFLVHSWNNKIVFQGEERIFIFSDNRIEIIKPQTTFHLSFVTNGHLLVRQRNIGIFEYKDGKLQLVQGSEIFGNTGIFAIHQFSKETENLWVTSRENGLWQQNKTNGSFKRIITPDSTILKTSGINGAIALHDGNIAIFTQTAGILVTDKNARIIAVINKSNGLKMDGVLALTEDFQGNLWAATDNGVTFVTYSSPLQFHNSECGITGNIRSVTRFNHLLYVGTTGGIFIQNIKNINKPSETFVPLEGFSKDVNDLCEAEGSLLVATETGLFDISKKPFRQVSDIHVFSLHYLTKQKILLAGGNIWKML